MERLLQDYLTAPETKFRATLERLSQAPESALQVLLSFQGPYPPPLLPLDVFPDHLQPLVTALVDRHPHLLAERSAHCAAHRWVLTASAIETANPLFSDFILAGLRDRSMAVKLLVVGAVTRSPALRTMESKQRIREMLELPSFRPHRRDLEEALKSFDAQVQAQSRTRDKAVAKARP